MQALSSSPFLYHTIKKGKDCEDQIRNYLFSLRLKFTRSISYGICMYYPRSIFDSIHIAIICKRVLPRPQTLTDDESAMRMKIYWITSHSIYSGSINSSCLLIEEHRSISSANGTERKEKSQFFVWAAAYIEMYLSISERNADGTVKIDDEWNRLSERGVQKPAMNRTMVWRFACGAVLIAD